MKRFFFYILFFLICNNLFSQTSGGVNIVDSKGRKQGIWKKYYQNGRLRFTGKFINNTPIDTFRFYYESGKLKGLKIYSEKNKWVRALMFHEDSTVMIKGYYKDTIKDSTWVYFSSGKTPVYEISYKNGRKNGIAKTYNTEGNLLEELSWKNGIKDGIWIRYYPDKGEKIYFKTTYKNDKWNGLFQGFNADGILLITGMYKDNLKNNLWIYYTEKSEIGKREFYTNGVLTKEEVLIAPPKEIKPPSPESINSEQNKDFNFYDTDR